jgi:hypothetical protein
VTNLGTPRESSGWHTRNPRKICLEQAAERQGTAAALASSMTRARPLWTLPLLALSACGGTAQRPALLGADAGSGTSDSASPEASRPTDAGSPEAGADGGKVCSSIVCSSGGWCRSDPTPGIGHGPVWVDSSDDVWAADGSNSGLIFHWDGCTWTMMSLAPLLTEVRAIWGSGPDDVYAVTLYEPSSGEDELFTDILHWDGKAWSLSMALPLDVQANLIAGSGPNDVWVPTGNTSSPGGMMHFDGTTWTSSTTSGLYGATGIWVNGPSDVWLTALNGPGFTQHWDGATWTSFDTMKSGGALGGVGAVWGSATDDVWAFWANQPLHWDGTGWTAFPALGAKDDFTTIWGSGPNDVWAGGKETPSVHWDGKSWTSSGPTYVLAFGGSSSDNVWATGTANVAERFDGTVWSSVNQGAPLAEGAEGVWGSGPDDVWVGANDGLRHWNGSAWSVVSTGFDGAVGAIWGSGPKDVWAVGGMDTAQENLLHWNGTSWSKSVAVERFPAIWGSGPSDVWVVSQDTPALHWDGKAWTPSPSKTTTSGLSVWGSGPDDVWIAGGQTQTTTQGEIVHYDGKDWSVSYTLTSGNLQNIWGSGPSDVWATDVGPPAQLVHWNGKAWTEKSDGGRALGGMWGTGPDDVWFTGYPFAHWDGKTFTDVPTSGFYDALWGTTAGVWAVGDGVAFHP